MEKLSKRGHGLNNHFKVLFFLKQLGQPRPLFHLFSSFQTQTTIFTANKFEKMSIQYTVPGIKLTTFGT